MENSWLPSKKTFYRLVLASLIIILIALIYLELTGFTFVEPKDYTDPEVVAESAEVARATNLENDNDGDGLEDWEEALWGMSPNNADTDGDGINDFDEVQSQRTKNAVDLPDNYRDRVLNRKVSKGESFGRDLYTTVAAVAQSGNLDDATKDQIIYDAMERVTQLEPELLYTADILTTQEHNRENLDDYITKMNALNSAFPFDEAQVIEITKILSLGLEDVSLLEKYLVNRQEVIEMMIAIQPTTEMATAHIDLINKNQRFVQAYGSLVSYEDDPMIALTWLAKLQPTTEELLSEYEVFNRQLELTNARTL